MFAEIVPPDMRNLVYAFDRALEGAVPSCLLPSGPCPDAPCTPAHLPFRFAKPQSCPPPPPLAPPRRHLRAGCAACGHGGGALVRIQRRGGGRGQLRGAVRVGGGGGVARRRRPHSQPHSCNGGKGRWAMRWCGCGVKRSVLADPLEWGRGGPGDLRNTMCAESWRAIVVARRLHMPDCRTSPTGASSFPAGPQHAYTPRHAPSLPPRSRRRPRARPAQGAVAG